MTRRRDRPAEADTTIVDPPLREEPEHAWSTARPWPPSWRSVTRPPRHHRRHRSPPTAAGKTLHTSLYPYPARLIGVHNRSHGQFLGTLVSRGWRVRRHRRRTSVPVASGPLAG